MFSLVLSALFLFRIVFGCVDYIFRQHCLKKNLRVGVLSLLFVSLFAITVSFRSIFLIWSWFFISLFSLCVLHYLANFRTNQHLREKILPLLNQIVVQMRVGKSFRQAFADTYDHSDVFLQQNLKKVHDAVMFSQQICKSGTIIDELAIDFMRMQLTPHKSLQQLEAIRWRWKMMADFRRRSGQITSQVRIQSYVMLGLYFALTMFVVCEYGFADNKVLFLCSLFLFSLGAVGIFTIPRRFRWKL